MAAYKITSDIVWSSTNFDAVIGKIEARLKAIPPISIKIDASTLGRLKRSLLDIERIVARIGATKGFGGLGTSVSSNTKSATAAFGAFQSSVEKGNEGLKQLGVTAAATIRRFSAFIVISNIVNTVGNSLRTGVHQAVEYEKQMLKISQVTGLTMATLGGLDKEITHLSVSLGVSSQKLIDVSLTLAQAGLSAENTKTALRALAKTELAATFGDIKNTTEATIAIMQQFGKEANNLEGILSAVNTVSAKFAVEAGDITTGVRTAGGAFAATGANFNEFMALMTTVRATTRESAESIATGIRTITTRLQRPRTQNFLQDMGIQLRDAKGEFIGIYPAVEKLAKSMESISGNDPRFSQILEEIAGYRQIAKVIPLLRNFSMAQKVMAAAQGSSNSVARDAVIAQQSLSNAIVRTKEEFYALIRKIVNDDAFQRMAKGVLGLASSFIKLVDSIRPLIPLLSVIGGIAVTKAAGVVGGALVRDLVPSLRRRTIGRASGGYVPGTGSGDTVPAMLTPGEFVIRKSAAQAIGPEGLNNLNKYAGGGIVKSLLKRKAKKKNKYLFPITNHVNGMRDDLEDLIFVGRGGKNKDSGRVQDYERINKYAGGGIVTRGKNFLKNMYYGNTVKDRFRNTSPNMVSGPSTRDQIKDLFSRGGLRRSLGLNDQESMLNPRNWSKGDANYANGSWAYSNQEVRYPIRRTGRTLGDPRSSVTPTLQQDNNTLARFVNSSHPQYIPPLAQSTAQGNGTYQAGWNNIFANQAKSTILPRFQTPNYRPLTGAMFPHPGLSPLPHFTGSPVDNPLVSKTSGIITPTGQESIPASLIIPYQIQKKAMERRLQKRNNYHGSKKSVSQKLRIKKMLQEFHQETGVDPVGLISSIGIGNVSKLGVGRKKWSGSYDQKDRAIEVFLENIKKSGSYSSVRSVKGVVYHELGHAIDHLHKTKGFASLASDKTAQAKLAAIYKSLTGEQRQKLFDSGKMSKRQFNYRNGPEEEFANFFSEYTRGKLNIPSASRRLVNSLMKKLLSSVSKSSILEAIASGRTLDNVVGLRRKKFAAGGHVPGVGSGDTVPAMLTPGEFVINKKSAQAIGYDKLAKANKYGIGGKVKSMFGFGKKSSQTTSVNKPVSLQADYGLDLEKRGIGSFFRFNKWITPEIIEKELAAIQTMTKIDLSKVLKGKTIIANNPKNAGGQRGFSGIYQVGSRNIVLNASNIHTNKQLRYVLLHEIGHAVDHAIGLRLIKKNFIQGKAVDSNPDSIIFPFASMSRGSTPRKIIASRLKNYNKNYKNDSFYRGRGRKAIFATPEEQAAELFKDMFVKGGVDKGITTREQASQYYQFIKKSGLTLAKGGHVPGSGSGDTVPALLTPGEFVINKKSAQAIGYNNLTKANKYATGGKVQKFANGGGVLDFAKKNAGMVGTMIFMAPAIAQTALGEKGGEEIKPLLSAITLASVALVGFSFAMKQNMGDVTDTMGALIARGRELSTKMQENQRIYQENKDILKNEYDARRKDLLDQQKNGSPTAQADLAALNTEMGAKGKQLLKKKQNNDKLIQDKVDENLEKRKQAPRDVLESNRWNKWSKRLAVGAAGAGLIGATATNYADHYIQNGTATGYTQGLAMGGGALSGGMIGAVGGAMAGGWVGKTMLSGASAGRAGPIAAAVGAAAAALYYGAEAFSKAGAAIENVKLDKKIESFGKNLEAVNTGKSSIGTQRGGIDKFLKEANEGFESKKDGFFTNDLTDFKGKIGQSTEALNTYLDTIIKAGVKEGMSGDKLIKENENLILTLARFGNQSITDLEKKIKDTATTTGKAVKAEKDFAQILEENNRRLDGMFNIIGAMGDAERSSGKIGSEADILDQIMNGFSATKSNIDFSSLSDIGSARLADVREQATRAGGLIGGPGVDLGRDVIAAAETVRKIPLLLNELVYSDQITEDTDLTDRFRNKLGKNPATDLVMAEFQKMLGDGQQSPEFTTEFKRDPIGTAKRLQAAVQPMVDVLADAAPRVAAALDAYTDGLARSRENFFKHLDGLSQAIDIEEVGADIQSRISGKPLSYAENQAFDDRRGALLSGGRTIDQLGLDLNSSNAQIKALEAKKALSSNPDERRGLSDEISKQIQASEQSTKALEYSADINSRLTAATKELEKMERARDLKKDMATGYAFGGPEAKKAIIKQLANTGQIVHNLDAGKKTFEGVSLSGRQSALELFQQHMEDRVFNGKTGRERLDQINEKEGFIVGVSPAEKAAGDAAKAKVADAEKAQKIINDNWKMVGDEFSNKIGQQFDKFIADLRASMLDRVKEVDDARVSETTAKLVGIEKQLDLINKIGKTTGMNLHNEDEFKSLLSNISTIDSVKSLQNKNKEMDDISAKYKAKGFGPGGITAADVERTGMPRVDIDQFTAAHKDFGHSNASKTILGINIKRQQAKNEEEAKKLYSGASENLGSDAKAAQIFSNLEWLKKLVKTLEEAGPGDKLVEKAKDAAGLATGGPIWKKRGSDTVPAMTTDGNPYMLTPGEFVLNKRAVGKYGIKTLEKMNHLAGGGLLEPGYSFIPKKKKETDYVVDEKGFAIPKIKEISPKVAPSITSSPIAGRGLLEGEKRRAAAQTARHKATMAPIEEARRIKRNRDSYMGGGMYVENKLGKEVKIEGHFKDKKTGGLINRSSITDSHKKINRDEARFRYQQTYNTKSKPISPLLNQPSYSKDLFKDRQGFQSQKSELMKKGMSSKEASQFLLRGSTPAGKSVASGGALMSIPPERMGSAGGKTASPASGSSSAMQMLNPDLMKEFNAAINKLAGSKLEISLNGTLNVNVSEGNLNEKVTETLKAFAETYVMDKIDTAINNLVKDANLAVLPKAGKKGK